MILSSLFFKICLDEKEGKRRCKIMRLFFWSWPRYVFSNKPVFCHILRIHDGVQKKKEKDLEKVNKKRKKKD